METLRYDYKPKLWSSLLLSLFFAGCAVLIGKSALENDRGLILNGLIELDTGDATIFYWVLTALCAAFVAIGILSSVRAMGAPHQIVLDATTITAPKGVMGRALATVPYARVDGVEVTEMRSQKLLTIRYPEGKLVIARGLLPSKDAFEELLAALDTHRADVSRAAAAVRGDCGRCI